MKEYGTEFIRNVALVGHLGSGKTSLVEALLYDTATTTRLGKIEDGTAVSDYDEEEHRRKISVSTSLIAIEFENYKINLLDTPGFNDFMGEVKSALRVADGAIIVVDAVSGVEVGTELVWQYCDELKLPRIIVINKMDRENANFTRVLESIQNLSKDVKLVPVQFPWGEKQDFKGVIGLLSMRARKGGKGEPSDIPAEYKEAAEKGHLAMMEAAAEGEDALLEKYLGGEMLTNDEITHGFKRAVDNCTFVPVLIASATANVAITPILETITRYMPSPTEIPVPHAEGKAGDEEVKPTDTGALAAYAFKTTADPFVGKMTYLRVFSGVMNSDTRVWNHNRSVEERLGTLHIMRGKEQIAVKTLHTGDIGTVAKLGSTVTGDTLGDKTHPIQFAMPHYPAALYTVAVNPKTQSDATKMGPTLSRLCEEDLTLHWRHEHATHQTLLEGMGDQHIDVAIRRAEAKFGTAILTETPRVPYRESITKNSDGHYRHKKQSGGAGQFGEVYLRIEPYLDDIFDFQDELVGMNLSKSYLAPIEKGIKASLEQGVIAGYPMGNVRVIVYDGKMHEVDSKPMAFEIAGREAFKLAVQSAGPVLREPIMMVKITVPEASMGDILSDLNTRRARVQGMEQETGKSIVVAEVPQAEMLRYVTDLRSMTQGRGVFTMEYIRHDVVPNHIAQTIIANSKKGKAAEEEE
ncbi:MAG: elongation factor G [Chloroflexi bacterium]|nr:elongation factor G [Chloroflexota bacterium]MBI5348665.1 elongation factor G [Chloroflexota bacterium]